MSKINLSENQKCIYNALKNLLELELLLEDAVNIVDKMQFKSFEKILVALEEDMDMELDFKSLYQSAHDVQGYIGHVTGGIWSKEQER
jgi:hypothetical protein